MMAAAGFRDVKATLDLGPYACAVGFATTAARKTMARGTPTFSAMARGTPTFSDKGTPTYSEKVGVPYSEKVGVPSGFEGWRSGRAGAKVQSHLTERAVLVIVRHAWDGR